MTTQRALIPVRYTTEAARWQAVVDRDPEAAEAFVYAVRTTGVFCRPGCASRRPRQENVRFFGTAGEARRAGFRPCRRCHPDTPSGSDPRIALVAQACRSIDQAAQRPNLDRLAAEAGLSRYHFHRLFKSVVGLTPQEYAAARRGNAIRDALNSNGSVTEAVSESGYTSLPRFYRAADTLLGMPPGRFKRGGEGETIRFALGECSLGSILVAATSRGICAIELGDDPQQLLDDFQRQFHQADLITGDSEFDQWVAQVVGLIESPGQSFDLPLDVRGTAFQQRVWKALRAIPPGTTLTYTQLAEQLGMPRAVRAVGHACATNRIAVAIPCHRIVRTDGSLAGYRWGLERKRALIERERAGSSNV